MRRWWLALWFAVLGWDALLPHIESPAPLVATLALGLAALGFAGRDRQNPAPTSLACGRWLFAVLAAACALAAVALPWPERLGPILLGVASIAAALPGVARLASGAAPRAVGLLGAITTGLAGLSHLYRIVESELHDLDFLAPLAAATYRLLGLDAAADPPFVHWQGAGMLRTVDVSMEKLVGHGLALFVAAGLGLLGAVHGRRLGWRRAAAFLGLAAGYAWLRYTVLGLALDQFADPHLFYTRAWVFGTLLPFVALLAAVLPPARGTAPAPAPASVPLVLRDLVRGRAAPAFGAVLAAGLLAAAAFGFHDPGRPKAGRILIDERHSDWEWSTIRLETQSYGVQTVYNYSELVRYLGHFWQIGPNFEVLGDSVLAGCDVLVLKTPTRPYDEAEVDAVVRFVERGGGLWMIGDHTNVFGMSTNLNKVARRFGFRFRYDAVIDLLTRGRQLYERPRLFAHPVVRHVPPLLMATSCSLEGGLSQDRVMLGRSLLSDELDYSVNTFFGNFSPDASEPFGSVLQSLAITRGRGRVLVFSDSTIFSNFFMFIRGKPELALGSVGWLMRSNRFAAWRAWLLAAAFAAAAAFAVTAWRVPRPTVLAILAVAGLPAFAVTARGLDAWTAAWSHPPEPNTPLPLVAFERGRTAYGVPDIAELPERSPHSFHTFYVWTQRVGYVPTTRLFERCLENSRITVVVNPRDHFSPTEVGALADFVRQGSSLLVLDSPHARHSTANSILEPFGMRFEPAEVESVLVHDAASGDSVCMLHHVGVVSGGQPVLLLPDGRPALAVARVGDGRVVAFCGSDNFSDAVLGTTSEVPTPEQLALYRLEFRIFDDLLRLEPGRAARDAAP